MRLIEVEDHKQYDRHETSGEQRHEDASVVGC